jgi:hypothetical protein
MGISGLGWCLAPNVCALSVGTIPNSFWYNITSNKRTKQCPGRTTKP